MPRACRIHPARLSGKLSLISALLLLAACGSERDNALPVAVIGSLQGGKDASGRLGYPAQLIKAATAEGLVAFDEEGHVVPALADRWIVTDDGRSYIFRLRDGRWADDTRITGGSTRTALLQAIAAVRGTALGLDLSGIEEVRAMAGRVIEIRLKQPEPDLLQLLAQPELGLLRGGRGAGPMRASWQDGWVSLRPIPPEERGLGQDEDWEERARAVELHGYSAANALARFGEGSMTMVLGGKIEDLPRLDMVGLGRGGIRFDQAPGLFGLVVQHQDGFLAEPANREALAMAIDREALLGAFNLAGWISTTRVLTPGLDGDIGAVGERWVGQDLASRRASAAARVTRLGRKPAPLRIALPAGPGADLLFERLSADFTAIGLSTTKVSINAPADLRLIDQVARYPRAGWFFNQLNCASLRGPCNPTADLLFSRAKAEPDPAARAELIADAEAELMRSNLFIPFGTPLRWSLVGGDVTGFAINRWAVHPLMPMALRPK